MFAGEKTSVHCKCKSHTWRVGRWFSAVCGAWVWACAARPHVEDGRKSKGLGMPPCAASRCRSASIALAWASCAMRSNSTVCALSHWAMARPTSSKICFMVLGLPSLLGLLMWSLIVARALGCWFGVRRSKAGRCCRWRRPSFRPKSSRPESARIFHRRGCREPFFLGRRVGLQKRRWRF